MTSNPNTKNMTSRASTRSDHTDLVDRVDYPEDILKSTRPTGPEAGSSSANPPRPDRMDAPHQVEEPLDAVEIPPPDPRTDHPKAPKRIPSPPSGTVRRGSPYGKAGKDSLKDTLKDWMDTVVQQYVPEMAESTLVDRMKQPLFAALLEARMTELVNEWTQSGPEGNPLSDYIRQELDAQMAKHKTPKFVLVQRTESLDQPQVIEDTPAVRSPYLPAALGGQPPDDDPDDSDTDEEGPRGRRHSRKQPKKTPRKKKKSKSKKKKKGRTDSSSSSSDDQSDSSTSSSSSSTTSEDEDTRRRAKARKANLKVFVPLNDWYVKACDYKSYRLKKHGVQYRPSMGEKMRRYRQRMDPHMKGRSFSGQDPITVLSFLKWFQKASNLAVLSDAAAMLCFQFYLTGQAYELVHSRLAGETSPTDVDKVELLHTYDEVVNFLIKTYVTDEVISDEYNSVMQYRQSTSTTEQDFANKLWDKAQRSGTVFSDRRLKAIFADNLHAAIRRSVNNYLSEKTDKGVTFQDLARYAQGLGDQYRAANRKAGGPVDFPSGSPRMGKLLPKPKKVMSISVDDEDDLDWLEDGAQTDGAVLAIASQTSPSPTTALTSTDAHGKSPKYTPLPRSHPKYYGSAIVGSKPQGQPRPIPRYTPGLSNCRLCLGEHPTTECQEVPAQFRDALLAKRDSNYAQRREDGTWVPKGRMTLHVGGRPQGIPIQVISADQAGGEADQGGPEEDRDRGGGLAEASVKDGRSA